MVHRGNVISGCNHRHRHLVSHVVITILLPVPVKWLPDEYQHVPSKCGVCSLCVLSTSHQIITWWQQEGGNLLSSWTVSWNWQTCN